MKTAQQCRREDRGEWVVTVYRANYSSFNGHRFTPSNYSEVICRKCGRVWRTNAAYVEELPKHGVTNLEWALRQVKRTDR